MAVSKELEKQREAAQERGDTLSAEALDRDPELKLGPAANSMERRAKAMAERDAGARGEHQGAPIWIHRAGCCDP